MLGIVYTYNVKGFKEAEKLGKNECTLHHWTRSPVMSDCSRPYQYVLSQSVDCNTKNEASLQKLTDKSQISGKR